ncbi:MAG: hypothetical protein ACFE9N_00585 [Promethearchaeota archaeon]
MLDFLIEYHKITHKNIDINSQYNEIVESLILIVNYNMLLNQKQYLLRELELSKHYKKSSEITASSELLEKLNESLVSNKTKLKLLEMDFLHRKNQIDQVNEKLADFNSKIQELTKQKKHCFSQINKITREMSEDVPGLKNEKKGNTIETNNNLSNAERIKRLQKTAKEIQFEINKNKSKVDQIQFKLEELRPIFEIYKKDYHTLLDIINTEEKRIKDLQSELKEKIKDDDIATFQNDDLNYVKSIRPINEIKEKLQKIETQLDKLVISKNYYNPQNPIDLSLIITQLKEFDEKVKNLETEITITTNEKEISESLDQFRELENHLNEIEILINKFITEINLISQFRIIVKENLNSFLIELKFMRNDNPPVNFEELTTPEKIFFILVFYISIKLHIRIENIILSNVSILSKYNKAGSIFRTIRKILPIFEIDNDLSNYNLIFILPNLELKKVIKNLKTITIKES